jgi:hypothetical protein
MSGFMHTDCVKDWPQISRIYTDLYPRRITSGQITAQTIYDKPCNLWV